MENDVNGSNIAEYVIMLVGCTGIEPVTSCLSSMRSEPTELTPRSKDKDKKRSEFVGGSFVAAYHLLNLLFVDEERHGDIPDSGAFKL